MRGRIRTASGADAREGAIPSSNRLALTGLTLGGPCPTVCEGVPVTPAPDDRQRELFDIAPGGAAGRPVPALRRGAGHVRVGGRRSRPRRRLDVVAPVPRTALGDHDRAGPARATRTCAVPSTWLSSSPPSAPRRGSAVGGVTVPQGGLELLPAHLRPPEHENWDWWYTEAPPVDPGIATVDLDGADPRLEALLAVASPDAPIRPGNPRVARWACVDVGIAERPDTGGLAAMVAVTHLRSGAAHLNDVATHPEMRGRRLARALCAQVTRDAFDEGRPAVYARHVLAQRPGPGALHRARLHLRARATAPVRWPEPARLRWATPRPARQRARWGRPQGRARSRCRPPCAAPP